MLNIQRIQELSDEAKPGEWLLSIDGQIETSYHTFIIGDEQDEDSAFVVALVNAWPDIYKELKAGRKLAEGLREMDVFFCGGGQDGEDDYCDFDELRDKLIQEYEDSISV